MQFIKRPLLFALPLLTLSSLACQAETKIHHIIAPTCLTTQLKNEYQVLAKNKNLMLIAAHSNVVDELMQVKTETRGRCGGFMDVTQTLSEKTSKTPATFQQFLTQHVPATQQETTYKIQYKTKVNQLLKQVNPEALWNDLTTLTQFENRFARNENGLKATEWMKDQVQTLIKKNQRSDISVRLVETPNYKQPSLVVKIGQSDESGVVIGGHLDTYAYSTRQPGADDDGSGSATVLETIRTIINSGVHFKKPLYFIWYAAEEEGLIGSQQVVSDFKHKKIPVSAVLHMDMTGYVGKTNPKALWLVNDNVDSGLTSYLTRLIKTYVKRPVANTRCGYGCSDHASWTEGGYKSAIAFETAFEEYNPYIHSANDTLDNLSREHMADFAKLAVAFAVELAEPI